MRNTGKKVKENNTYQKIMWIMIILLLVVLAVFFVLKNLSDSDKDSGKIETKPDSVQIKTEDEVKLNLNVAGFKYGQTMPVKFTCEGDNVSPNIKWSKPKSNKVKSYSLIFDDPDAPNGLWVHWILYNIPFDVTELREGITWQELQEMKIQPGLNSWNNHTYGGPCPPDGEHRYFFKIYALDSILSIDGQVNKEILEEKMKNHIVSEEILLVKYEKKSR